MKKLLFSAVLSWCLACAGSAQALEVVEVDAGQVRLGQLWPAAPRDLQDLEVAVAPPAGGSRLISRQELLARLRELGADIQGLKVPQGVRVKTRSETWSFERIETVTRDALQPMLKPGVEVVRVRARGGIVVPTGAVAGAFELSKLPRRAGEVTVAGTLPLEHGGSVVVRVPVTLVLKVSQAAAAPLVARGSMLQLVVSKSSAQISALAEALSDADAGELIQFRVQSTRKVVQGVVTSPHKATLVMQ